MTIMNEEHRYDYRNLAVLSQRQSYLANTWITIAPELGVESLRHVCLSNLWRDSN